MADIAKKAGIAEGTLYLYFENKNDLLNEVAVNWSEQYLKTATEELVSSHGIEKKVEVIVRNQLTFMFSQPDLYFMFLREIRTNQDYRHSKLRRYNKRYTDLFKLIITPAGALKPELLDHINLLRDVVYGSIEHVGWRYVVRGEIDESRIPEISKQLTQLIMKVIDLPEEAASSSPARDHKPSRTRKAPPGDTAHTDARLSKIERLLGLPTPD